MIVYYKRKETYCKYPFNKEVDQKWIEYSMSKNKYKSFLKSGVDLSMKERVGLVAKHLNINKRKIVLIKI